MMAQLIFAVAPVWIVEAAVGLLGPFAKHLGFLACVVVYSIGLIAATVAFLRFVKPNGSIASQARVAAFSLLLWGLSAIVLVPLLGGDRLAITADSEATDDWQELVSRIEQVQHGGSAESAAGG